MHSWSTGEISQSLHSLPLPEAVLRNSSSLLLDFVVFEELQSLVYSAAPSGLLEAALRHSSLPFEVPPPFSAVPLCSSPTLIILAAFVP